VEGAIVNIFGEMCRIVTDSSRGLYIEKGNKERTVLYGSGVTSFDGVCSRDGCVHIFTAIEGGILEYIKITQKDSFKITVSKAKAGADIFDVQVLHLQGRFHIFYSLKGEECYLVHQILWEDGIYEPRIIDVMHTECEYSAVSDGNSDIHIVYTAKDKVLTYVRYVYSLKKYTSPVKTPIADCKSPMLCMCGDRLFTAYTKKERTFYRAYTASIPYGFEQKMVCALSKNDAIAVCGNTDSLKLHFVQGDTCYEVTWFLDGTFPKEKRVGKTKGIYKIISFEKTFKYPVDRNYSPIGDYAVALKGLESNEKKYVSLKEEMEDFSTKGMADFERKAFLMFKEETEKRLAKLESDLGKIIDMYINDTKTASCEYTETTEGGMEE